MDGAVPPYFDYLIEGFRRGESGRFVHLGLWDTPPDSQQLGAAGEFERAQERLNDRLLDLADLADGQSVVDVGCGFGGTLAAINERCRDMKLAGVNIDRRQLDICRGIEPVNGNTLDWYEASADSLPFDDDSLDRVLCIEAMFHFASRAAFFQEAARVLRPGGTLTFSDIALSRPAGEAVLPAVPLESSLQDGFGPWPAPWIDIGDYRGMARDNALDVDELVDVTDQTAPSHHYTAPGSVDDQVDPGDPGLRASVALRWMHRHGSLRYLLMRFRRPTD